MDKISVLILAGGLGSRIRSVNAQLPKVMLPILKKPFLEYLILNVGKQGLDKIVLCVGHKAEQIKAYFQDGRQFKVNIEYSYESKQLGTGGAIIKAASDLSTNKFIVMNGDSFIDVDLLPFLKFHDEKKALCSIVLRGSDTQMRFGSVTINNDKRVTQFLEKKQNSISNSIYINAGVYCINKEILDSFPSHCFLSVENDIFPQIVQSNRMYGFICERAFIDIGIPSDYFALQANPQILTSRINPYGKN